MTAPRDLPGHRALVREAGKVHLRLRPTPYPSPGELLVTTPVAGLCGTDIQMLRGLRDDPAPVIGHEGVVRVVAAGPGIPASLAPGTPVVVNPTHGDDPSFLLGHNVDGLLQEFTLIPATAVRGGLVVPLEQVPDAELGTLVEPLAAVRYALGLLAAARPRTLVVYGDGNIGQLAVRAARGLLGTGVRVLLVHHTPEGRRWSERHPVTGTEAVGGEAPGGLPPLGDGPTAALLATPRDGTLDALASALRLGGGGNLTVDLFGGLPPGAASALLPGVDLAAVRAANCAGRPVPAVFTEATTAEGRRVRLTGHRGVGNGHLLEAAAELWQHPELYRDLVTHVVEPAEAARIMNGLAAGRRRTVDGNRLLKLAVRFAPAPAPPREKW
ncbi:alcohol dehydrogenase catalytic domain-containing protein [Streptomyces nymphaeiformis]|uniref:D-arabinose 1-dehydrogenase-like Zn-dependent alcohol dehydrogenase n=1 Tax=Streptomyces nymphaeiformis TaxID=2663842 RepID=A0A7W7TX77_9ACTN|nr:alcohol dehydrogenase catalytic domain-containing protein [Streptomyces nymphaeiformis]MBB4980991.1 D-arabinose 1-dehydrogenase-like Zn-dependent alcohol dehydrogenase [Streptomyces nymphaeiformis]